MVLRESTDLQARVCHKIFGSSTLDRDHLITARYVLNVGNMFTLLGDCGASAMYGTRPAVFRNSARDHLVESAEVTLTIVHTTIDFLDEVCIYRYC